MSINALNKRITIQSPPTAQDSYGELTGSWSDVSTVWASVVPIVGREYFQAETVQSEISHKIRIRYKSGIVPKMRVKFGSRYFEIQSVLNYKEGNAELQLMCKELI